jgi:hypothetical protein
MDPREGMREVIRLERRLPIRGGQLGDQELAAALQVGLGVQDQPQAPASMASLSSRHISARSSSAATWSAQDDRIRSRTPSNAGSSMRWRPIAKQRRRNERPRVETEATG